MTHSKNGFALSQELEHERPAAPLSGTSDTSLDDQFRKRAIGYYLSDDDTLTPLPEQEGSWLHFAAWVLMLGGSIAGYLWLLS